MKEKQIMLWTKIRCEKIIKFVSRQTEFCNIFSLRMKEKGSLYYFTKSQITLIKCFGKITKPIIIILQGHVK